MATRRTAPAPAPAAATDTHQTILSAIRILLDASGKTATDPAGARALVGSALRLLVPIVAPGSHGPDDETGTRKP